MKTQLLKLAVFFVLLSLGCKQGVNNASDIDIKKILPPIPEVNIDPGKYLIDATEGGIIKHITGTLINIPSDAFVDKDGKVIKGKVEIRYREMLSLSEIFLSGIPMTYDSAGTEYHFESAGMNEISAFQGEEPVFINKDKAIDICMKSNNEDDKFNLYYYDTLQNQWLNIGKDIPVTIDEPKLDEPLEPVLASDNKFSFTINVNYTEFPELKVFENTMFQLTDSNVIEPENSNTLWYDVKIEKGKSKGLYNISFGGYDKKAEYEVIPVYDKNNIDKAIEFYETKFEAYKTLLLAEIEKEKKIKEEKKLKAQKEISAILEKYNKEGDEQKKLELQQEINKLKMDTIMEEERKQVYIRPEIDQAAKVYTAIYRTYSIRQFGYYNSDCPMMMPKGGLIAASFTDPDGQPIEFSNYDVTLMQLSPVKMIFAYHQGSCDKFKFNPDGSNVLLAITSDGKLAYFTAEDFKKVKKSGDYTFNMRIYPDEINSSEDIDDLLALK